MKSTSASFRRRGCRREPIGRRRSRFAEILLHHPPPAGCPGNRAIRLDERVARSGGGGLIAATYSTASVRLVTPKGRRSSHVHTSHDGSVCSGRQRSMRADSRDQAYFDQPRYRAPRRSQAVLGTTGTTETIHRAVRRSARCEAAAACRAAVRARRGGARVVTAPASGAVLEVVGWSSPTPMRLDGASPRQRRRGRLRCACLRRHRLTCALVHAGNPWTACDPQELRELREELSALAAGQQTPPGGAPSTFGNALA